MYVRVTHMAQITLLRTNANCCTMMKDFADDIFMSLRGGKMHTIIESQIILFEIVVVNVFRCVGITK